MPKPVNCGSPSNPEQCGTTCDFNKGLAMYECGGYGDGAGDTIEENSSIFSIA